MITLHILKLLENNGFGTIDTDLFFETVPLDAKGIPKQGVWIVTRGTSINRVDIGSQNFDIYSRYTNKTTGHAMLENILSFLQDSFGNVCELPTVPPISYNEYYDVMIVPTSGVENVGTDDQNKVVRVISGNVKYKKKENNK